MSRMLISQSELVTQDGGIQSMVSHGKALTLVRRKSSK